jgi:orotidine-5'-phosphate decarboxylase
MRGRGRADKYAVAMAATSLFTTKAIDPRDRLIFALDVPTLAEARACVERLGEAVTFYKIGLEFCMSGDYFALLAELKDRRKKVFADLKFSDVPATVCGAVANLARHGADFCTLHGTSGVYRAAVPVKGTMRLLAVTVLTSVDEMEVREMGWDGPVAELVSRRASQAIAAGIDGLICSGREAADLRRELGARPVIITPGIRAEAEQGSDDQKRTMTLEQAFRAGADYIVVGRPIRNAPNPRAAAETMQREIAALFGA